MSGSVLLHRDDTSSLSVMNSVLVNVWYGTATVHSMRTLEAAYDQFYAGFDAKAVTLSVIKNFSIREMPGKEVRDIAEEMSRRYAPQNAASAQALLMTGLVGATVRAFMTGITIAATTPVPTKIFGQVQDACDWVQKFDGPDVLVPPAASLVNEINAKLAS